MRLVFVCGSGLVVLCAVAACSSSESSSGGDVTPDRDAQASPPDAGPANDASSVVDTGADVQVDAGPPKKRVFISSAKYAGDLKTAGSGSTGLDGADKLCTSLATAASLGGAWKAFLDTHNVAAATRMADVGPWFIVDATGKGKTEVFASKATLDTTEVVPNVTEIGSTLAGGENFWTGSTEVYNNCTDFTATGSVYGNETMPRAGSGWSGSAGDNVPCTTMLHIICLEQ